jgi:hypothetical protein
MSTCTVFYDDEEWTVDYDYSPGRPGVHTLRNGDPGYPDDPPELWINVVRNGVYEIDFQKLPQHDQDDIEQQVIDHEYEKGRAEEVAMYEAWAQNKGIDP